MSWMILVTKFRGSYRALFDEQLQSVTVHQPYMCLNILQLGWTVNHVANIYRTVAGVYTVLLSCSTGS